jgi:hypothetical protein
LGGGYVVIRDDVHKSTGHVRDRNFAWFDLLADTQPYRLLLAHTSAKNFLLYETQLRESGLELYDGLHRMTVINRGSWGELRFTQPH